MQPEKVMGRFCKEPFERFEILTDGQVSPCCSLWIKKRLGNVYEGDLEDIWNSNIAQMIRLSILEGNFKFCNHERCKVIVNDGLPKCDDIVDKRMKAIIKNKITYMDDPPKHIFLANDETCNLSCPSCRDRILVADSIKKGKLESVAKRVVFKAIESQKGIKISISGQGDPWASSYYRSILRHLSKNDCGPVELSILTNAVLMTEENWSKYLGLERYKPCVVVSIDAATSWTYNRLRCKGDWKKLMKNLEFIGRLRREKKFKRFEINMTVQAENYLEMLEFLKLGQHFGCDAVLYYLIQNTGPHLSNTYREKNVANSYHPEHLAFMEVLRDSRFNDPLCQFFDVQIMKEKALSQNGTFDKYVSVINRQPSAEELYESAIDHLNTGELNKALELAIAGFIRIIPDPAYLDLAGLTLRNMGALNRAESCFRTAHSLDPENPVFTINLGKILMETGQFQQGIFQLKKVMKHNINVDAKRKIESIIAQAEAHAAAS